MVPVYWGKGFFFSSLNGKCGLLGRESHYTLHQLLHVDSALIGHRGTNISKP